MKHFNIRVYGIWIDEKNKILVSDERIKDFQFTKFPGGGLEFGEGIVDCLIREWREELNIDIEIIEHFYTTDFFKFQRLIRIHKLSVFITKYNQNLIHLF